MNGIVSFLLVAFILGSHPTWATTIVSAERGFLGQMNTAMKIYSARHNGQQVTTWEQVREVFDVDDANKHLRGKAAYPLEDHYEFVPPGVSAEGHEGSEVILLRTVPLQEASGQPRWRYLIIRTKGGGLSATRFSEEEVQAMFQKVGVQLPIPKPWLPRVETENLATVGPSGQPTDPSSRADLPTDFAKATPSTPPPAVPRPVAQEQKQSWPWVIAVVALGAAAVVIWMHRN